MAAGVEIRMPFMDYRLVTFLFSLPWQSKVRKGYTKALVRDALRDIMPEPIVNRTSKIGFNTPIVEWMKGPWKEWLLEMVYSKTFEQSSLIQPNATRLKVLEVINRPDVSFLEGEQAWISLSPYLWQSAMNKNASEAIYA
jgi:asparagine synthase (glutamine-hydrolysing)